MTLAEAQRQYQLALEHERRVKDALSGMESFDGERADVEQITKAAKDEVERIWNNAVFWRMVDGFVP
jgi:hypothetical protein